MSNRKVMKQLGRKAARTCGAKWRRCIVRWHDHIESASGLRSWVRRKSERSCSPGLRLYHEITRGDEGGEKDFWEEMCWNICAIELDDAGRPRVLMETCRDSHDFIIAFVEELVAKEQQLTNKRSARNTKQSVQRN